MDPILRALLVSWDWRIEVIGVLALAGTLYVTGWSRLRKRTQSRTGADKRNQQWRRASAGWRPFSYLSGLVFAALALISPLDTLASSLFSVHMIQHLLLIMIAPPLLLLANPMPFMLWGLPTSWRLAVGKGLSRLLHRKAPSRRWIQQATLPGVVWMIWFISILAWHDPAAYDAALRYEWVHDLEHITFFAAGMLFWWHVTGAGPRLHKQFGLIGRIAFTLSAVPPNMLTGVVLAFGSAPFYTYYLDVPRIAGLSALDDQRLGGLIMWIPGSMMYLIATLALVARLLHAEERRAKKV